MKLHLNADSIVVRPLDPYGNPGSTSIIYYESSAQSFTVTFDQNKDQSVWFGIDAYGDGKAPVADLLLPKNYNLLQNYPNPFSTLTTFSFELKENSFITLKVFDQFGREVATIVSDHLSAGNYAWQWNAANITGGIYFYRFEAGKYTQTKKLILLR